MKSKSILLLLLLNTCIIINSPSQEMPLVYSVENTTAGFPKPIMPSLSELPTIPNLPDPFAWTDGRGRISNFSDWQYRRAEISAQIQNYEIGEKPVRPDTISASYNNNVLTVKITKNGKTLTLTAQVILPIGTEPFPAVIGLGGFSGSGSLPSTIFSSRNIAQITFNHNQVTTYGAPAPTDPYYLLYPSLNSSNTGQYSAWSWGVSRIIDGLELVQNVLPIDLKHLAVTGCSWAGKLAIFAGAFDERIALTIGQESGGGGYTTWRVSQEIDKTKGVETLGKTDYNWFKDAMRDFSNAVSKLPEDHHELMAMVAPRALLVTGNPDYVWLADESGYVGSQAAKEVWNALGIPDRFGFSIVSGHTHCQVPASQTPEIEAFVDKFLLGKTNVNTDIATAPYSTNLSPWITWTTPILSNGSSIITWTTLVYPNDLQTGLDTNITFRWNKIQNAEKYFIEISVNPGFTNLDKIDTTTTDTLITINGLLKVKKYYWHVKAQSSGGASLWSDTRSFITTATIPAKPQLFSATPTYPNRADNITLKWRKMQGVDQYYVQLTYDQTFATIFKASSISDTSRSFSGLTQGQQYYWRVQAKNFIGTGPWSDVGEFIAEVETSVKDEGLSKDYSLDQNYPNPFNPSTAISYQLPVNSKVKLEIFNTLGEKIFTLVDEYQNAGFHTRLFTIHSSLPSGIYFCRLKAMPTGRQAGNFISTKKLVLIK